MSVSNEMKTTYLQLLKHSAVCNQLLLSEETDVFNL